MNLLAHYRCVTCSHSWQSAPSNATVCRCGSLYVEWTNFEQWRASSERSEEYRRVS